MQSRLNSFIEQIFNVGSGFIISLLFWIYVVVPVWELEVSTHENLQITLAFTVLSVVRGFIWRRIFNYREKAIIVEDMQLREMLRDSYKENSRLLGVQHHLSQSLKELEGMRINNER